MLITPTMRWEFRDIFNWKEENNTEFEVEEETRVNEWIEIKGRTINEYGRNEGTCYVVQGWTSETSLRRETDL